MALVRYQSPDDSTFTLFDQSRFRVDHAIFLLWVQPLCQRIDSKLEEQRNWNLAAMKLVEEHRRLIACREWLSNLPIDPETVVIPELKHEPAIDVVADWLIVEGQYDRAYCPACEAEYRPEEATQNPWEYLEDGVTAKGRRTSCPIGHTIHVLIESIEADDLESTDDDV